MDLGGSDTQKLKIHFVNHIDQCLVRSLRGDHCADESECIVSVHNICFLNHDAKLIRRCAKLKHNGGSFSHKNKKKAEIIDDFRLEFFYPNYSPGTIAPIGQASAHVPQSTQVLGSIL